MQDEKCLTKKIFNAFKPNAKWGPHDPIKSRINLIKFIFRNSYHFFIFAVDEYKEFLFNKSNKPKRMSFIEKLKQMVAG
jgi:hypothetical protein